jgi:hypothetical protein
MLGVMAARALEGFYYQMYTDEFAHRYMQPRLSCVTAIFDEISPDRGFFFFHGYNTQNGSLSTYKGALNPSYRNKNCYEMVSKTRGGGLCLFPVGEDADYLVATNGNFSRTFVLSQHKPEDSFHLHSPGFALINETIAAYHLPTDLVQTNHRDCFFYPPFSSFNKKSYDD